MPVRCDLPSPDVSDADLVERYHAGDTDALLVLLERYRRFAAVRARTYFLAGGDSDDIEQEGMIGLFKAARDFRGDRESSFRAFAELCITRQVISAVKSATRHKHRPLNQYVSLSGVRGGDDAAERSVEDLLDPHAVADPADAVISNERMAAMRRSIGETLSGLEVEVLRLYVEGKSYQEISAQLGRHVKSIDNALQRIKRKLEGHLNEATATEDLVLAS
ncbi:MAG: RNA polymerase sporulation sigma factor SigH [Acidimicrobiales bacterium]